MKSVTKAQIRWMATYIAMVVRNEMENFHCKHLTDSQMKELNPIVRNAIYTALYAANDTSKEAERFVQFQISLIPDYWEPPELSSDFKGEIGMTEVLK